MDVVLLAGRYTLLDQGALADLLPACVERSTSVVIGGVFNSGILVDPTPASMFDYRPATPEVLARAQRLAEVCERHGVPLAAAALQFPLAHAAVATVLVGARNAKEVEQNGCLLTLPIPHALWDELRGAGLLPENAPTPMNGTP
jgi:D-threo-aldose 1-dehydrogenase